jgi:hypothetical protein
MLCVHPLARSTQSHVLVCGLLRQPLEPRLLLLRPRKLPLLLVESLLQLPALRVLRVYALLQASVLGVQPLALAQEPVAFLSGHLVLHAPHASLAEVGSVP